MAITVNHQFVSAKGDGSDATLVRPSNWNASHNINMATNNVIGRRTAGPGLAEEIPASTFMLGLLATADFAALAVALGLPTTGDAKLTFKNVADAGWVLVNDSSIGDALSGGGTRANADTVNLFTFFYNNFTDVVAPLLTSTGTLTSRTAQGTATTAFGAHCRILLPRQLGRALIVAGAGAGLTNRVLGDFAGEEAHQLTVAELAAHAHGFGGTISGTGTGGANCGSGTFSGGTGATNTGSTYTDHVHDITIAGGVIGTGQWLHSHGINNVRLIPENGAPGGGVGGGGAFGPFANPSDAFNIANTDLNHNHGHNISASMGGATNSYPNAQNHSHTINVSVSGGITVNSVTVGVSGSCSGTVNSLGGNVAHNNMQPWTAWNVMIKL